MKTCLSIAGSDPSGGAGIQADLKTFTANGVYGMTVITALTAQNTTGVQGIYRIPADFIKEQLMSVFTDIPPDAVKIGMLSDPEGIEAVARTLKAYGAKNIVIDPVMVATSGAELSDNANVAALRAELFTLADLITPNIPEAEVLTGMRIDSYKAMITAARLLSNECGANVLIKGGHARFSEGLESIEGAEIEWLDDSGDSGAIVPSADLLLGKCNEDRGVFFAGRHYDNPNTHGTGCTLSSAIAARLAKGLTLPAAVAEAKRYVSGAIKSGIDLGKGRGPLNHSWSI